MLRRLNKYFFSGVVISSASTGGAVQLVLGQYEYVEDKGYYVQSSTEQNNEQYEAVYLYSLNGTWRVGPTPGVGSGWLQNNSPSQIPPTTGWMYADGGGHWQADDAISVTPGPLPPLPRQFTVTATGATAETQSSRLGVFTRTQRWWAGRPVYVNTEGELLYHGGFDDGWQIGPKFGWSGLRGSRAYDSPVHEDSWTYWISGESEWKPASVTVTE